MGSFRLTAGTPHLHGEFNFTEPMLETAGKSLRHSCRSELTRQGISLDWSYLFPGRSDFILTCHSFIPRGLTGRDGPDCGSSDWRSRGSPRCLPASDAHPSP